MRLISARVRGFGRIVDSKINLDSKVIAIVGPNEAGKTTLLKALSHVDSGKAVTPAQRSRATEVNDDTPITTFDYVIEPGDLMLLSDLDLQESPRRAKISRSASASRLIVDITPLPVKSVRPLERVIDNLRLAVLDDALDDWIDPNTTYADPESDAPHDYRSELQSVIAEVEAAIETPGSQIPDEVIATVGSLLSVTLEDESSRTVRSALECVNSWATQDDPGKTVRDRLWRRTPDFVMFDESDRSIQSSYLFDESLVANLPSALANLAGTAGLDLPSLLAFLRSGDVARRRTAITRANRRMDDIFRDAWKQSPLSVHFEVDGDQLRIELMEGDDTITVFDERSAGLRMFVALIAFLKVHASDRPPVLLIDEAENHLHIDAQADLVNMFVAQQHAVKIIYTTHSPACLPPDLGTGIRTVVPRSNDLGVSDVKNSFWQGSAGYSPLMLAMGAGAAAFTPARYVALAEGATEMILLPSLMRTAVDIAELPFQVAPGLSEASTDFLPRLDLEAAHVAYIVDGDSGGAELKKSLVQAGVPEELIAVLGVPGIENVIDRDAYCAAIEALLPECNASTAIDDIGRVPSAVLVEDQSYANTVDAWIKKKGLSSPSKVAVANWLVVNGRATPSAAGAEQLRDLFRQLCVSLKIEVSGH